MVTGPKCTQDFLLRELLLQMIATKFKQQNQRLLVELFDAISLYHFWWRKKVDAFIIPNLFQKNDYSIADKTKATEQIAVITVNTAAIKAEKEPE
jgi:hypothetical protein